MKCSDEESPTVRGREDPPMSDDEEDGEEISIPARLVEYVRGAVGPAQAALNTLLLRAGINVRKGKGPVGGGGGEDGWSWVVGGKVGSTLKKVKSLAANKDVRSSAQSIATVLLVAICIAAVVGGVRNHVHQHYLDEKAKTLRLKMAMQLAEAKNKEIVRLQVEKKQAKLRKKLEPELPGMKDSRFVDATHHKKFVLGKGWVKYEPVIPRTKEEEQLEKLRARMASDGLADMDDFIPQAQPAALSAKVVKEKRKAGWVI